MALSLNIALKSSFSSKQDLKDELDNTTLITHRISACETDTDLSIESKVGDDTLLLLRLSDGASELFLSKYKVDIDSLVFTLSLCFLLPAWLSRLDFPYFPHQNLSYKAGTLL